MAPTKLKFYLFCDEYGNTGANLVDYNQPVFVYSFLILRQEIVEELRKEVVALYDAENISFTELKSSTLWQSSRGLNRYRLIGDLLHRFKARACISLIEKRYQICSIIVETFLDPLVNESVPPSAIDPKFRQLMADALYDYIDNEQLSFFLDAVKKKDKERISSLGHFFATRLSFHIDPGVSFTARFMRLAPDQIFVGGEAIPEWKPASQYAGFYAGLQYADQLIESLEGEASLVRDEDNQYGQTLDRVLKAARDIKFGSIENLYGAKRSLDYITSSVSSKSELNFGIQLADLLAGIVGRCAKLALAGTKFSNAQAAALEKWVQILMPLYGNHYWMIADRYKSFVESLEAPMLSRRLK